MYIGDEGVRLLCTYLRANKHLKALELKGNNITDFDELLQTLRGHPTLKILSLEWNQLGSSIETFASFIVNNRTIKHLGLSNNKILDMEAFSNALKSNKVLLSLDLRWNDLGEEGGRLILDALQENRALLYLELNGCNIPENLLE